MSGEEYNLKIFTTTDGNLATIAEAYLAKEDLWGQEEDVAHSHGTALRHPSDQFDAEVADNLAVSRALENIARKLRKRAEGKMRHNDYVREERHRLRDAREQWDLPRDTVVVHFIDSGQDLSELWRTEPRDEAEAITWGDVELIELSVVDTTDIDCFINRADELVACFNALV